MNRTLSHLDALLEKRNFSGSDRLASLNRSIESIERKLGNMGNAQSTVRQRSSGNLSKFEQLERKVRELTDGLGGGLGYASATPRPTGYPSQSTPRAQIMPQGNPLAEIAERKRALYSNAHNPVAQAYGGRDQYQGQPAGNSNQANEDFFNQLSKKIEALRAELSGELNGIQDTVVQKVEAVSAGNASSAEELERIAQGIRELQQAPSFDPSAFDALHSELDNLRMSLGSTVGHEDFSNGINDLNSRLDQISGDIQSVDTSALDEIKAQLEQIGSNTTDNQTADLLARVNLIGETVSELTGSLAVDKIDQRLQSLAEAVERLVKKPQADDAHSSSLDAIEARLDEITRAIVAVSVSDQTQSAPGVADIERLENRIVEIAQGLESIGQRNGDEQFAQLAARIDAMAANIDAMDNNIRQVGDNLQPESGISTEIENQLRELAKRLDSGTAVKQGEDSQISQLASRIDGLSEKVGAFAIAAQNDENLDLVPVSVTADTSRIEEQLHQLAERLDAAAAVAPAVSDTSQIEQQLQYLAERLDAAVSDNSADNQLQNLELQIANIAAKLGNETSDGVDLSGLENRLGQIDQNIAASRDFTLEAATRAAQSAIEMMDEQNLPNDLISALAEDLRSLQNAASQSETRTIETFDNVKSTLNTVVDRLGQIESSLQKTTNVSTPVSDSDNNSDISSRSEPFKGLNADDQGNLPPQNTRSKGVSADLLEKITQAPSIDPSGDMNTGGEVKIEDHRPLEPGSGAPEISTLVKRASEKFADNDTVVAPEPDKTDFVAAARRAAQAAVSEVDAVETKTRGKKKPADLLSQLRNVPRRPVIIAAAAILMAVIAYAGTKYIAGNNGGTAVVATSQPEVKGSIATATPENPKAEKSAAPVKAARPAVSNAMQDQKSNKSENPRAAEKENMTPMATPTMGTSSFNTNPTPKQTSKFTALPGTVMASPEMPVTANPATKPDNRIAMAAPENNSSVTSNTSKAITSAPLPPENLGPIELRQAAAKGNVRAQHEIALRYSNGVGVKRNMSEAAKWYERAAAKEFAPAQYRLGSLYEKGLGVKRDLSAAMNWYSRAADLGNARAMHNLAVINAMGAAGKPNMKEALKWFTNAANLGVKDSQFNLGILYGQGMGVKQDLATSYKWFAIAAKTGDVDSAKKRDEVANVMDPKALDKARIEVRDWRPKKLVELANRVVIPESWRKAGSTKSAALTGKDMVRQTQMILNKLGYKVGRADGLAGPKTRRAILSFQKKTGLKPTGKIDAELVKALEGLNI